MTIKKRVTKSAYNRTRIKTAGDPERKSKCVQSEKHASDINNIMARAHKTGQLPVLMNRQEVTPLPDGQTYQDALNKVVFAQQQFEQLPSEIRTLFENDPKKLLDAIHNSKDDADTKKQLQTLGIIETPPAEPLPLGVQPDADKPADAPVPPPEPPSDA